MSAWAFPGATENILSGIYDERDKARTYKLLLNTNKDVSLLEIAYIQQEEETALY